MSEWISVKDKLPPRSNYYRVMKDNYSELTTLYDTLEGWYSENAYGGKVTRWKPFEAPVKKKRTRTGK